MGHGPIRPTLQTVARVKKTCIIFNPTAGGDKAIRFRDHLASIASALVLKRTDAAGAARRLAREAVMEGFTTLIAAGGDGTVNEVLNGIGDVPDGLRLCRLAVVPLGTVNVFAKELKIPAQLRPALSLALGEETRVIDLPVAEFTRESDGAHERRYFAQLAGSGLDARAIDQVKWSLKKRFGPFAYVIAGFSALRQSCPPVRVISPERSAEGELVLVGNGRFYGGRFELFPGARFDDGLLDVAVFPKAVLSTLLRFGAGWTTGKVHRFTGAEIWRSRKLTLECDGKMPFELDGDNVGHLPVTFTVEPRRLRVAARQP